VIVCKNCGHQNEDNDTFCGSCGKFLEWTGERVAVAQPEPEPAPPPPPPTPEPTHVGLMDRVKHAVGIEEVAAQPQPAPPVQPAPTPVAQAPASAPVPPATPLRTVPFTSAAPPAPSAATPWTPPPATSTPLAPAVPSREPVLAGVGAPAVVPTPSGAARDDEPISRRPTSVAPAVARPRPAARSLEAPTRRHPGDLICGQCGEGNDPVRHFCRRCGNTLDEALVVSLPWYRRFFNRVFRVREREAGWRPKRVGAPNVMGGVWRIIRLALFAVLIVAVLAFALIQPFRAGVINRVTNTVAPLRIQLLPHYDAIHPTGASASTATAGHLPTLAVDHYLNTYWAASANDPKPYLKVLFATPVDLATIGFDSGASGTAPADAFAVQPRPKAVHIVCSDGTTKELTLKDEDPTIAKNAQFYTLDAKQVTYVEIFIESTYLPAGAAPSSVAISEVEFKTKD